MLLLALFASVRVFQLSHATDEAAVKLLGMDVPHSALWAALLFVGLAFVAFLFTYGMETGLKSLDKKTHALIDLLVDTQSELSKVSWPGSEELTRSTTAVLVSILLLGVFLLCVDWLLASALRSLNVLP